MASRTRLNEMGPHEKHQLSNEKTTNRTSEATNFRKIVELRTSFFFEVGLNKSQEKQQDISQYMSFLFSHMLELIIMIRTQLFISCSGAICH